MIRTYRNLDRLGIIAIQFPIHVVGDKVSFEYMAAVPQEWARQDIKAAAGEIRRGVEREREKLGAQLEQLYDAASAGQDTMAQIESLLARHREYSKILEG